MKRERKSFQPRKGKQNIFRSIQAGRSNVFFQFITDLLFALSSYPSHISEVFLRKRFGERYFTSATAIVIFLFMIWVWFLADKFGENFLGFTWLLFAIVFLVQSIRHRLEIRKFGTTYDFQRFSYSHGEILPFWWQIIGKQVGQLTITPYHVFILLEPALPTLIGLFLMALPFTRGIGILLFISGLAFGFRNFMKAHIARGFILDQIDEQIVMAAKHDVLVEQKPMRETKGLCFPIELPQNIEIRENISNALNHNPLDVWDDDLDDDVDEGELIPA